ncbi:MAG: hypothetical protein RR198_04740 [Oscillospiraceae bacterium]
MPKTKLTEKQKKVDTDLWIIIIATFLVFGIFIIFQKDIYGVIKNAEVPILFRVFLGAIFQYGLAGFGITLVAIYRKERFSFYGLKTEGMFSSIALCSLSFIPNIVFNFMTGRIDRYLPFHSVWTTNEVLSSGFPINAIGMLMTATAWGFFEGFNYVVISEKINKRYPIKYKWLNLGAIVCAVICILIHGAIGVTPEGIIEMITVMIIVYGMLTAKEFTGNAWGCVFIFVFLWNAF